MSTQIQVAKHLDLTTRRVRDLVTEGILPKGKAKGLDLTACRIAYIQYLRQAKNRHPQPVDDEKILLIREQRIAQQMRNEQTRREVAPVNLISWTLSKVGSQISGILDSIPLKIKTIAPRLSATEIDQICREIVKCQNVAASVDIDLDEFYGTRADCTDEETCRTTERTNPDSPPNDRQYEKAKRGDENSDLSQQLPVSSKPMHIVKQ